MRRWVGIFQSLQRLATGWTVRGSNPDGVEFDAPFQKRPWVPLSLLHNGYRVFPVGEAAEVWRRTPPSSTEVKEIVELYVYSSSGPSWPVLIRRTLPLLSELGIDTETRSYPPPVKEISKVNC